MIVFADEAKRSELVSYLNNNIDDNVFLLGNVNNYPLNGEICNTWLDYSSGNISGVVARYDDFFLISGEPSAELIDLAIIEMKQRGTTQSLLGREYLVKRVASKFNLLYSIKTYMRYETSSEDNYIDTSDIIHLDHSHVDIVDELLVAVEFGFNEREIVPRYLRTVAKAESRYYGKFLPSGELVALAATAAESPTTAMIVSVCCKKAERGNGYAAQCVAKLTRDLSTENKLAYLFYENPIAGRMYARLGYNNIGELAVLDVENVRL